MGSWEGVSDRWSTVKSGRLFFEGGEGGGRTVGDRKRNDLSRKEKRGEKKIKMNRTIIEAPRNQEGSRRPCLRYLN